MSAGESTWSEMPRVEGVLDEVFEYRFSPLDPVSTDHIDPPSVAIYETLLNKGPGGRPQPGLADRWEVSADGLVWDLHLREGARFHSGAACDSRSVLEALELCRWGDGLERQIWYWDPVDRVEPRGVDGLRVRLLHATPRLPVLLWGTHTAIVNPAARRRAGSAFGVDIADGTGPYRLTSFSEDHVEAELIEGVRRPSSPRRIRWHSVPQEADRLSIFTSDRADVVRDVPPPAMTGPGWRVDDQAEVSQIYWALSFDSPWGFEDVRLRRALEAFVDRERIVREALDGLGDGRRSPVPVGDEFARSFDPSSRAPLSGGAAARTLAELGFDRREDGSWSRAGRELRIRCVAQDTDLFRRVATALVAQLAAAGVHLEVQFVEPFQAFYRAVEDRPDSFLSKWLWPDAMEAIMGFSRSSCRGAGGGNWQGAVAPALDACFDRFLQAGNGSELEAASRQCQDQFMSDLPYIPVCSTQERVAVGPRLTGFGLTPRTLYPLYDDVSLQR